MKLKESIELFSLKELNPHEEIEVLASLFFVYINKFLMIMF